MADNFNLRTFLTENKLTKNAQLLKEEVSFNGKPINVNSIEIDGIDTSDYPDFVDAYIVAADYADGTPLTDDEVQQFQEENYDLVSELIHDRQLYLQEKKEESMEEKVEEAIEENRLTAKERRLVEMVNNAMGMQEEENVDYTMGRQDDPNQLPNPAPELNIPEGEDMVEEKPMPKYESIDQLMKEIEHGTNEAAHKYKMEEMKRIYELLETKVTSLEEGENAEHIDQSKVKQMRKDIAALRKAEEKLRKEFEKKFTGKEKKEAPKAEKEAATEALQETKNKNTMENFDLKKFLTENKLTTNSRMVSENGTYAQKEILRGNIHGFKAPKPEELKVDMMVTGNKFYGSQEELNQEMGRITAISGDKVTYKKGDGKLYNADVADIVIVAS